MGGGLATTLGHGGIAAAATGDAVDRRIDAGIVHAYADDAAPCH
jgi:hypothetical protein